MFLELAGIILAQAADGAGQTPGAAEGLAASVQVTSVWDFVIKGGVMMIPIGLCSIVALTVVVERLATLRRRRVIPPTFLVGLKEQFARHPDEPGKAVEYCRRNASPVANIFAAGLRRRSRPLEVIERHIQDAGQREVIRLRKYLRVLSVIAAVTPLMGLLGTIFGMIRAFQTVATSADALGKTELLAEGIYEAMITTAAGLIVAIPTLICYHWLAAKVQSLVMDMDLMTVEFVEDLDIAMNGDAAEVSRASGEVRTGSGELEGVAAAVAAT